MRKIVSILLALFLVVGISACDHADHTGEARTPSGSSALEGLIYTDVVKIFEDNGFTNIKLEKIEDLIVGWLTKEGEVEDVSVGGDINYSPDKWLPADTEVIIRYHAFPEDSSEISDNSGSDTTENEGTESESNNSQPTNTDSTNTNEGVSEDFDALNVNNCPELSEILSMKAEIDDKYTAFATKYAGRTIEFDGRIDYCTHHGNYKTRFDYLVSAGDYDPNHQIGPAFKFENVNYYDLNTDLDEVSVGLNVHIVAKVGNFDINTGLFFLTPLAITGR